MGGAISECDGVPKQRGFWLRCFLESADRFPSEFSDRRALKGHEFTRANDTEKNPRL